MWQDLTGGDGGGSGAGSANAGEAPSFAVSRIYAVWVFSPPEDPPANLSTAVGQGGCAFWKPQSRWAQLADRFRTLLPHAAE
eukprot:619364-Prorocentrum_minimum.AAC.1